MELITSRSNSKIKQARAIKKSPAHKSNRLFLVEGIRQVGEALEAAAAGTGFEVIAIFFVPDQLTSPFGRQLITDAQTTGISCHAVTLPVFESLVERENPQGILAVARYPNRNLEDLNPGNFPWGVALVAPQDPGNIGSIIRTIDAVGASGLLLLDGGAEAYHPGAVRASMGMVFWYPVVPASFAQFIDWAGRWNYTIYGTSAHGEATCHPGERFALPRVLLMGSERQGLTEDQRVTCHKVLRLPMKGRATSLNLAVATGVLLYAMMQD